MGLAGGGWRDLGGLPGNMVRRVDGGGPRVIPAEARLSGRNVDRWAWAELGFADGGTARMTCSLFSSTLLRIEARVVGESGQLFVFNPLAPHIYHHLSVRTKLGRHRERVPGESSYKLQLRAFIRALRSGTPPSTDGRDGVANMAVIDAIYTAAGLPLRGTLCE